MFFSIGKMKLIKMLNLFQPIEFSLSKFDSLDPTYQTSKQSVPLKISSKSIFINFGRKKILKIGNCREFDSKQRLYLELVVKMCSYLSGNQRNFEKMSENHRKSVFFFRELVFQFSFFKVFLDRNQVYKVLGCLPCPFFRFFALLCRKIHFLLSNLAFFAKPKEILTKSMVCG